MFSGDIVAVKKVKSEDKKQTKSKKSSEKMNFSKNKKMIVLVVSVIIFIIILLFLTQKSSVAAAQLIIDSGSVQIKHSGDVWVVAEDGMLLFQSDSIKTGDNSSASIVLFKSSIIRLDSNTEVTLKNIIQKETRSITIQQDTGRTWSTIQKISGVDDYEVQTPTAVASVRGTSFDVNIAENEATIVSVVKGIVNVTMFDLGAIYSVDIGEGYSVEVDYDKIGDPEQFDLDDWIRYNLLMDESFIDDLKDIIYERLDPYISDLKTLYGMSDEEIEVLVEGFIRGELPIPDNLPEKYKEIFDLS